MTSANCSDHVCKTTKQLWVKLGRGYGFDSSTLAESGIDNSAFILEDGGGSGGNSPLTGTIEDEISDLLLDLMIKNREGTVDLERIRMVRLQASRISTNLKRLEKLIQEESSEDAREEIKRVIKIGIKNLLPNPEC